MRAVRHAFRLTGADADLPQGPDANLAAWRRQFEPPPPPRWWERLWPFSARGGLPPEADPADQRLIRIAPARSDGTLAAPAELSLPPAALRAELGAGLFPAASGPGSAQPAGGGSGSQGATRVPPVPRDNSYFTYNSSAMTPLVPLWLAWMTDAQRMANRSQGLDFPVRPPGRLPAMLPEPAAALLPAPAVAMLPAPAAGRARTACLSWGRLRPGP